MIKNVEIRILEFDGKEEIIIVFSNHRRFKLNSDGDLEELK